jgi:hypothetical protein
MSAIQRTVLLPLILSAGLIACDDDEPTGAQLEDGFILTTLVSQIDTSEWRQDPFTLLDTELSGDTLNLHVAYGGGCLDHEFALVISSSFMESDPVQTFALLSHDDDDDPCDAVVLTWLMADLTPLKQEWQASYQAQSGTIVMHLDVPILIGFRLDG